MSSLSSGWLLSINKRAEVTPEVTAFLEMDSIVLRNGGKLKGVEEDGDVRLLTTIGSMNCILAGGEAVPEDSIAAEGCSRNILQNEGMARYCEASMMTAASLFSAGKLPSAEVVMLSILVPLTSSVAPWTRSSDAPWRSDRFLKMRGSCCCCCCC